MDGTVSYLSFVVLVLEADPRIFAPFVWAEQEVTIEACQRWYRILQGYLRGFFCRNNVTSVFCFSLWIY